MEYLLSNFQLTRLLEDAAYIATLKVLIKMGKQRTYLNRSQANAKYGRSFVERNLGNGLLTPKKDGNYSASLRIDHLQIETLSRAEKAIIFFKPKSY